MAKNERKPLVFVEGRVDPDTSLCGIEVPDNCFVERINYKDGNHGLIIKPIPMSTGKLEHEKDIEKIKEAIAGSFFVPRIDIKTPDFPSIKLPESPSLPPLPSLPELPKFTGLKEMLDKGSAEIESMIYGKFPVDPKKPKEPIISDDLLDAARCALDQNIISPDEAKRMLGLEKEIHPECGFDFKKELESI